VTQARPPGDLPGAYLRRISLVARDERTIEAGLEDDFHRFGLTLTHDGERVVTCEGRAERFPWTECPGAIEPLRALAGVPLSARGTAIAEYVAPQANCTHLFDLAGLAVALAARGDTRREYLAVVPDRDAEWRTRAWLECDGVEVLAWDVAGIEVEGPDPFTGIRLRGGFQAWVTASLSPADAELALVLRRACEISMGRHTPWDDLPAAIDVGEFMLGVCHTFQPGRAEVALRVKDSVRDFSDDPSKLLRS